MDFASLKPLTVADSRAESQAASSSASDKVDLLIAIHGLRSKSLRGTDLY